MKTRRTMHFGAGPSTFLNAQILRKNPSPAEEHLWKFLSNKQMEGVKFRRQHPLDIYVIDFYSQEVKWESKPMEIITMQNFNPSKMRAVI